MSYPCTVRARRATLTDDEFWQDINESLHGAECDFEDPKDLILERLDADPCPECGSIVACGYDSEGRPMIHVVQEDNDGSDGR